MGPVTVADGAKAPHGGMCKHRISYGIYKRATSLAQAEMQALDQPTWPEHAKAQPVLTVETPAHPTIPAWALVEIRDRRS